MALRNAVITVREVCQENLEDEFFLIQKALINHPYASLDTEFPGVVYSPNLDKRYCSRLSPRESYQIMKKNVDALKLIQLGLTLSDAEGNLPNFGTNSCYIWEFNFRDFDVDGDLQNPESIELLKHQGIDFLKNKQKGIDSIRFAELFLMSGLAFTSMWSFLKFGDIRNQRKLTWITFHSVYDFGFLVKVLTQKKLPEDLDSFMVLMRLYFGIAVYDMKQMIKYCGLYGGLERVAKSLDVDRVAGKSHQAGSDSLLTMQAFMKLKNTYFRGRSTDLLSEFNYQLYGLAVY